MQKTQEQSGFLRDKAREPLTKELVVNYTRSPSETAVKYFS